jgi:hypothetical protein
MWILQRDATKLNSPILVKDIKNSMTSIHTYSKSTNGSSHNALYHKYYCALHTARVHMGVLKICNFILISSTNLVTFQLLVLTVQMCWKWGSKEGGTVLCGWRRDIEDKAASTVCPYCCVTEGYEDKATSTVCPYCCVSLRANVLVQFCVLFDN